MFFLILVTNETDHRNGQCLGYLQQTDNASIIYRKTTQDQTYGNFPRKPKP